MESKTRNDVSSGETPGATAAPTARSAAERSVDEIDLRLLVELQGHARLTNRELAERVGLSPAPCWRRVRRLEEAGIITRYAALLDAEALGFAVTAFVHVSLDDHHPDTVARFDALVAERREVLECHAMSGQTDYLLKVVARSIPDYEAFLSRHLLQLGSLRSVSTSFVLRRRKHTTELPLGHDA
jgi:DNA-binding Lrp family transcriptional regulator